MTPRNQRVKPSPALCSWIALLSLGGLAALALSGCTPVAPGWDPKCKKPSANHLCCLDPPSDPSDYSSCAGCPPDDYACVLCKGAFKSHPTPEDTAFCQQQSGGTVDFYCADGSHQEEPACLRYQNCKDGHGESISCQPGGFEEKEKLLDDLFCLIFVGFNLGATDECDIEGDAIFTPRAAGLLRLELPAGDALEMTAGPGLERFLRRSGAHVLLISRSSGSVAEISAADAAALRESTAEIRWRGDISIALVGAAAAGWREVGTVGAGISAAFSPRLTLSLKPWALDTWLDQGGGLYLAIEAPAGRVFALQPAEFRSLLDGSAGVARPRWNGSADVLILDGAASQGTPLGSLEDPRALAAFGGTR